MVGFARILPLYSLRVVQGDQKGQSEGSGKQGCGVGGEKFDSDSDSGYS